MPGAFDSDMGSLVYFIIILFIVYLFARVDKTDNDGG